LAQYKTKCTRRPSNNKPRLKKADKIIKVGTFGLGTWSHFTLAKSRKFFSGCLCSMGYIFSDLFSTYDISGKYVHDTADVNSSRTLIQVSFSFKSFFSYKKL